MEEIETEVMNMWRLSFKLKAAFEQEKLTKPAKAGDAAGNGSETIENHENNNEKQEKQDKQT